MDKESSVRSNIIPDKIYNGTLDTLDKDDNEIESDLYSVKIFGKNIRIAPGRSKDVNPKCVYFYVYAIKNEKVVAKLGIYEKEITSLEDKLEIYDLTQFKDGSLLLFDVYYNKPDLISNLEELEELEDLRSEVKELESLVDEIHDLRYEKEELEGKCEDLEDLVEEQESTIEELKAQIETLTNS